MGRILTRLTLLAVPLLLLVLIAIAGYAYTQIRFLNLPIPLSLALFTVVLPFIAGITIQGSYGLIRRTSDTGPYQLTIPPIAVIGFQLIYETVVATLALTHILPPSALQCGLESKWYQLYNAKDGAAIRAIQDAFNCCGFNSVRDKSWPFGQPSTCAATFNRSQPCVGSWRRAEQINAGLLLLVAVTVFIVKVLSIISLLTSTPFTQWARQIKRIGHHSEEAEDNRAHMRRLIEENAEEYHDEPTEEEPATRALDAPNGAHDQGPRVEPSQLTDSGHEWRT
ncbi:hypothetical protein LZ554_005671 [Drepanopeziza brunnea f. sp. 'monogermtubi']|nr:hypothetical protein LZ554_005671 [Drepanopeziza brunnea f. sp. 'monogermtubi']